MIMIIKRLVTRAFESVGLSIARYPPPHSVSRCVRDLIRDDRINLVIDVGAFHGQYCELLRGEIGYTGPIVSFVPCADSYRVLTARMAKDRNWRGFPFALSDRDGDGVLNTYPDNGNFNSLLRLREEGAVAYKVDLGKATTQSVQLRKLDTLWSEITAHIAAPRAFLKIDTQGHDVAVMLGASDHRRYIRGIQSELPAIEIYDAMPSMARALELYGKLGYVAAGFYPINKPTGYGGLSPEFDVVLRQFHSTAHGEK